MNAPTSRRCLGLIGGLGPAATVHYYGKLVEAFAARAIAPRMVIVHADAGYVLDRVRANDVDALATYLAGHVENLAKAGADIAAIPAVTPHICVPALTARITIPLVDMIAATGAELKARGLTRIATMGTRYVMDSRFFGRLSEVDIVPLAPPETETVHDIYMGIVANARIAPDDVERLRTIARAAIARDRLQAIAIAGTDLALAFDEATAGFPAMDCAAAHIKALVAAITD